VVYGGGSPSAVPTVGSSDVGAQSAAVSNRAIELAAVDGSLLHHHLDALVASTSLSIHLHTSSAVSSPPSLSTSHYQHTTVAAAAAVLMISLDCCSGSGAMTSTAAVELPPESMLLLEHVPSGGGMDTSAGMQRAGESDEEFEIVEHPVQITSLPIDVIYKVFTSLPELSSADVLALMVSCRLFAVCMCAAEAEECWQVLIQRHMPELDTSSISASRQFFFEQRDRRDWRLECARVPPPSAMPEEIASYEVSVFGSNDAPQRAKEAAQKANAERWHMKFARAMQSQLYAATGEIRSRMLRYCE